MAISKSSASAEPVPPFDAAQIAVAVLDAHGTVTGWTCAAERLLGYAREDVLGKPAANLLASPEDGTISLDGDGAHGYGQSGWEGTIAARHHDGRRLSLAVQVFPLLYPADGKGWAVLAWEEKEALSPGLGRMMLEPLLTHSPVGVAVLDANLRYVWVNDVLTYGGELPRERRLGLRPSELFAHNEREEQEIRHVLESGAPALNVEFFGPVATDPARLHAWWECLFPIKDSAGRVLGVWLMAVDNTERWRAQERLSLLTEASARIGSTLDVVRTAQELADVAVPRFADAVFVDLLAPVLQGEEPPPGPTGRAPVLRRAAQQAVSGEYLEPLTEGADVLHRLTASLSARCLDDGAPVTEWLADFSAETRLAQDPTLAGVVSELGIQAVLVAPVQARGVRLGVATFLRLRTPTPFDREDASLAEELVGRAAVCLDNARRFQREREAALVLQQRLLPRGLTRRTMLEVASRYLPARAPHGVGGDWFDVIPLSGARVALVVGDVIGHGAHAAVTMGRLRAAVRTLADLDMPPDELLAHLDDVVISMVEQEETDETAKDEQWAVAASVLGATCLYAVYDPVTRRCTLARAGHLPPAIVSPDGMVAFPDLPTGPPLGLGFLPFESVEVELPDGAMLALFTNGLLADADVDAGLAALSHALAVPAASLEDVCDNVVEVLLRAPPQDDAALLIARTHGMDTEQVASWDLARDPAVVASARSLAAEQLAAWDLGDLEFTTELLVSELVTNAIRYGTGPIRLRLIRSQALICEVSDGSSTSPRLRHARTTDEGGRGLFLVAQLTRRWGTRYEAEGKIIWAEQSLPEPATRA